MKILQQKNILLKNNKIDLDIDETKIFLKKIF